MCHTKQGLDCDIGNDIKPTCTDCPAKAAFLNIKHTPHVVLNYKLALLYSELFPDDISEFPTKDLMVFDECHTLEGHLVNHRAVTIGKKRCELFKLKFFKPRSLQEAHEWLKEDYLPAATDYYLELDKQVKIIDSQYEFGGTHLASELRTKKDHKALGRHLTLVRSVAKKKFDFLEDHYVLATKKDAYFEFKEIYGAGLFYHILEPKANRFLFMSSTILNFEEYANDLGIPPEETAIIDLPSEFDKGNRPVYYMPTAKMSFGWDKKEPAKAELRDKMSKQVVTLLDGFNPESGVIHTGSFPIAKWLIGEIENNISQQIITHTQDDPRARDDCIAEFTENEGKVPMVLISPSVTEGLDLVGDTARFALFVKVPFPYLGDEWVRRRLDLSQEWYDRQAMISMIQGSGRIVRSHDDWGNTYILDAAFGYLWEKFKTRAPRWWKDAYVVKKKKVAN
jgi:Rad3-related DNA helicase